MNIIEPYSQLNVFFEDFKKEVEKEKQLQSSKPAAPYSEAERSGKNKQKRIQKVLTDFWSFDKTYFQKENYENYAAPNRMLKKIAAVSVIPGYHLLIGPRRHGKTVTGKKLLLWLTLSGRAEIAGVYCETLNKSAAILRDIYKIIINNDRLLFDFNIEFQEANSDTLAFTYKINNKIYTRFIASFSEGRSVKGYTRLFGRPTFLLADDIETSESSFSKQAVQDRIDKLSESYHSMNDDSTFIILGNDFNSATAVHELRLQHEQNLLPKNFNTYIYKAWSGNKPLWHHRYKVKNEADLKKIIQPLSEADWQANFQQNPIPPEGYYFKRKNYNETIIYPPDARGIIYCDPNLAKKGKGDTTAIVVLLYSGKTDKYYIPDAACKSYSYSNDLLSDVLRLKLKFAGKVNAIAFDGNVSQESTWTQHVKNFCRINNIPFPIIEYKRYDVDAIAKNLQLAYDEMKICFRIGFARTEQGERFLNQFFAFSGKKANKKDDAPDALISAFEFIHERKLIRGKQQPVTTFKDYYQAF